MAEGGEERGDNSVSPPPSLSSDIVLEPVSIIIMYFLFHLLCRAQARRVLYQALFPSLSSIVELVPPLLENASGNSKEAASMARALLRVQVSVMENLGQEVSVVLTMLFCGDLGR